MIIQLHGPRQKGRNMRTESGSLSHDPYWWDAAPLESPTDVALPKRCDVAIIGAGYAGLSAALTLARAGRSVVVLDALAPGEGASSRSGGMIGHGHRLSYTKLIERFGAQKAMDLIREGHGVARICESADRRREDRRPAAGDRADARRMDEGGLRDDDARCAGAAARSRHGGRRVEQGRCPPRDRRGLLPRRPAVSRARRRASGIVPPAGCCNGRGPPERSSRAVRQ